MDLPELINGAMYLPNAQEPLFIYDYNECNVFQCEMARELLEFKYYQTQKEAPNMQAVEKSGGAEWQLRVLSYIVKPFNAEWKKSDVNLYYDDICKFKAADLKNVRDCVANFFQNLNMTEIYSAVTQMRQSPEKMLTLLKLVESLQGMSNNKKNTSRNAGKLVQRGK